MRNQDLLAKAEATFGMLGVHKADSPEVMTTDSLQTGRFMDAEQIDRLVDLTVGQSGWLATTSFRTVEDRKGQIPRMVINDVITEPSGENQHGSRTATATTDHVSYDCKKYEARFYLTIEDIEESAASGEVDFEEKVQRAFGKALGNDMARWGLNGDESIAAPVTPLERLLAHNDGWLAKARQSAAYYQTARGVPYAAGLWERLLDMIPEEYGDDENLRFIIPRKMDMAWTKELRDLGAGSELKDANLIARQRTPIHGIPQLIIPQLSTSQGFSILSGSAVAADSVSNSSGRVLAIVSSLFGGQSTDHNGRKVRITCNATGLSEVATVTHNGSNNQILTLGNLGQSTISTTASDYTLDLADVSSVLLTNPANMFFTLYRKVRAYRVFEEDDERWKFLVKYEADVGIYNEAAMALIDGVVTPRFDTWGD